MRLWVFLAAATTVSGCSSIPPDMRPPDTPVTVAEIQRAVACEFSYALDATSGDGHTALTKWGAIVELTLSVKDSANILPGLADGNLKVGNSTLTTKSAGLSIDDNVTDKNVMAYFVPLQLAADRAHCKEAGFSSSGLQLADLLIGTAQVLDYGGQLTSTASLTTKGFATDGTLIGKDTDLIAIAAIPEAIPTIKYERSFRVRRAAGGELSFKIGDVSLALKGTGAERLRDAATNTIKITMGAMEAENKKQRENVEEAFVERDQIATGNDLIDSVFNHRQQELRALKDALPSEVIVITPPAAP